MELISIFFASFTIALSGALMPGPLLAAVVYNTVRHGVVSGPLMIVGHAIIEIVMLAVIVFGLGYIVNNPIFVKVIYLAGSALLLYFGISMLLSLRNVTLDIDAQPGKSSNLILSGITMSMANPYWTIWWLTIGMGLVIAARKQGLIAVAVFFAGHIFADLLWYSFVSLMIHRGQKIISLLLYRAIIALCAIALLAFGIFFALDAYV